MRNLGLSISAFCRLDFIIASHLRGVVVVLFHGDGVVVLWLDDTYVPVFQVHHHSFFSAETAYTNNQSHNALHFTVLWWSHADVGFICRN